jgi:hypothetical protein
MQTDDVACVCCCRRGHTAAIRDDAETRSGAWPPKGGTCTSHALHARGTDVGFGDQLQGPTLTRLSEGNMHRHDTLSSRQERYALCMNQQHVTGTTQECTSTACKRQHHQTTHLFVSTRRNKRHHHHQCHTI